MLYSVIIYEEDGSKRKSQVNKRPRTEYISKNDILMQELSLKISEIDGIFYLCTLKEDKFVKIYSESATHIIEGLNKLKANEIIDGKSEEGRKRFRRVVNKLKLKQCPYCGTGFKSKNNSQKYCSKDCSKKSRQDQDANRKRELRKQFPQPPIGTIDISPYPKDNKEEEMKYIRYIKQKTLNN